MAGEGKSDYDVFSYIENPQTPRLQGATAGYRNRSKRLRQKYITFFEKNSINTNHIPLLNGNTVENISERKKRKKSPTTTF